MSDYKLYCHPICPYSRQVKIVLAEAKIIFEITKIDYWSEQSKISKLNPACEIPILIINDFVIVDSLNIIDYIIQLKNLDLYNISAEKNCEIKRLNSWSNIKFFKEVVKIFIDEKIIKPRLKNTSFNTQIIKIARNNLSSHFEYFTNLLSKRSWIADDNFTLSDIILASHISVLDYLHEIEWEKYQIIKEFYSLVKSRPSFKQILNENISGYIPPNHYTKLDF